MPRRKHIETDCSTSSSSSCTTLKQCDCVPRCKGNVCNNSSSSCSSSSSSSTNCSEKCMPPIPCDDDSSSETCCDKPKSKNFLPKDSDCYECPPVHHDEPCKGKGCGCKKCIDECPKLGECKKNPLVMNPNKLRRFIEGKTCSDSSSSSSESSCGQIIVPKLGPGYQQQCEFVEKVSRSSSSSDEECDLIPIGCPFSTKGRDCGKKKCNFCCGKLKGPRGHKGKRSHGRKDPDFKCRTFHVMFADKRGSPTEHRITSTNLCITINKEKGPDVHLTRGHYYRFIVHPSTGMNFYFTIDSQGGPMGECADSPHFNPLPIHGTPDPVSEGEVIICADKSLPKSFYYQCKTHRCMGGRVFIHDSK